MSRDRTGLISVIVCTGLMAEFILPWAAIWLSDIFFFDIPPWLLWLLFGGPLALSLLAMLTDWASRKWSKPPFRP
jgi:ABC-type protease/lipase transport system fused ATPase/permease subunit